MRRLRAFFGICNPGACRRTGQLDAYCFCAGRKRWWD